MYAVRLSACSLAARYLGARGSSGAADLGPRDSGHRSLGSRRKAVAQILYELVDHLQFRGAASGNHGKRRHIAQLIGKKRLQSTSRHPNLGVVLRQIAEVSA